MSLASDVLVKGFEIHITGANPTIPELGRTVGEYHRLLAQPVLNHRS